ncbi:MAG: acyltransferase family protein [Ilumatobacteraceae bacterium]
MTTSRPVTVVRTLTPATQGMPASGRIAYQPALDGVRAIAVTMVLLFHGNVSWLKGGYFGVSMFFTLSGFLITSLLVREFAANQRIAVGAFYARRVRRLLPASLLCLSIVAVLGRFDVWEGASHLRRDVLGALFQVANWVQLSAGESYTDLQSKSAGLLSPLDHYWSLAIEEQFYWIWPIAFWALARFARRRGWGLVAVVGSLTFVCAVSAPVIAAIAGRDAAYWATPARSGEILLGATLAVACAGGRLRPQRWMAPVALATVFALAVVLPAAGGPAYHGAFPLFAIATVVLLLGLQCPGVVTSALSLRPLVALGKVSYGVYLYHFPAFVLMTPARVGVSGTSLLALRIAATLCVALLSSWLVERPIRFGDLSGARTAIWSGAVTAGVCGLALALPAASTAIYYEPDADLAAQVGIRPVGQPAPLVVVSSPPPTSVAARNSSTNGSSASSVPASNSPSDSSPASGASSTYSSSATIPPGSSSATDVPAVAAPVTSPVRTPAPVVVAVPVAKLNRPARILVVGDSTALATGAGLIAWAAEHPDLAQVSLAASPGCGFVRGGFVASDGDVPFQSGCDTTLDVTLPNALAMLQPDVVMLMVTARDMVQRTWDDDEGELTPPDPRYLAHIRRDYSTIVATILSASNAQIVWIRPPTVEPYWLGEPMLPYLDPDLFRIMDAIVAATIDAHDDRTELADLRAWMERDGLAVDHDARPDGWHFTPEAGLYVAETWLGPQLVAAAARSAAAQPAADPAPTRG